MRRAFTLVELLVVIAIIVVLIGILLPVVSAARQSAARVEASSSIRQLLTGYIQYTLANKGALPYGFPPDEVNGVRITAVQADGKEIASLSARRYPWRLIPYVANVWQLVFYNTDVPEDHYLKSVSPSIGLNSAFLGGHEGVYFVGYIGPPNARNINDRPNIGKHVAFKASEIRNSSRQIVFTESIRNNASFGGDFDGAYYVQPPRGRAPNSLKRWWVASDDGKTALSRTSVYGGLPNGRFKGGTLVGFFDGHVQSMTPSELEDMRLWCPKATSADWDFVP